MLLKFGCESDDVVEALGIELALRRAADADVRVFLLDEGELSSELAEQDDIVLLAKGDNHPEAVNAISGKTGLGVDVLLDRLSNVLSDRASTAGLATHARHATAMASAVKGIQSAQVLLNAGPDQYDIAAAELRMGIHALEALVGRIDAENLLDEIFASFCLGK